MINKINEVLISSGDSQKWLAPWTFLLICFCFTDLPKKKAKGGNQLQK